MYILGLSCYYHDSAAVLLKQGQIVAAAQEERFSRVKHDAKFPVEAIRYCLKEAGISLGDVQYVAYYEKPFLTFERLLETSIAMAPKGLYAFVTSMPIWLKEKLNLKWLLKRELRQIQPEIALKDLPRLLFSRHHLSHAASAFFPSPYDSAAVLCLDGVGEWATTSLWTGSGNSLIPEWEIRFPHSLGLLYSAFTYFCGFKVNSGEYKLMGLAPYGEPQYVQKIRDYLIDIKEDGSFRLNLDYFDFATGRRMTNKRFAALFGGPERSPHGPITSREMNLARSIQVITEEVMVKMARAIRQETKQKYLCLAGGVALNCVANGAILRENIFDGIWIQPAAGDSGGALGAALGAWHLYLGRDRHPDAMDSMHGAYLGPEYSESEMVKYLERHGAKYFRYSSIELSLKVAQLLASGQVVGWYQGRMEFGPRALGNRSILGDPRDAKMQSTMNLKIKFRESFRPFAPAVLDEKMAQVFSLESSSPYMLLVGKVRDEWRKFPGSVSSKDEQGLAQLKVERSRIPAVTHVDCSARVQSVNRQTNPLFHDLIKNFEEITGTPLLVNTSFNVRGEPIVCTPEDAYRCFMQTEMDYLVMGPFLLDKRQQSGRTQDYAQTFADD